MKNTGQSMVDTAYAILQTTDEPMDFYELWERIVAEKEMTEEDIEENISRFYTNITLDGRMITVGDNFWDLRSRHKFEEVHIDMKDVYSDEEEVSTDDTGDELIIEDNYSDN